MLTTALRGVAVLPDPLLIAWGVILTVIALIALALGAHLVRESGTDGR